MIFSLKTFKKALRSHKGTRLSNQAVYRYVNSALLTKRIIKNPLNSLYSYGRGYRFNFPYAFPALYLSFSDFVATLEAGQRPDPLSTIFDNREKEPVILYSVKISGHFANLTDEKNLKEFFRLVRLFTMPDLTALYIFHSRHGSCVIGTIRMY